MDRCRDARHFSDARPRAAPRARPERRVARAGRGSAVYRRPRALHVTARNPTTIVIGAGPVATALAGAMRLGGVPVLGLWARRAAPARQAGSAAGVAAFSSASPDELLAKIAPKVGGIGTLHPLSAIADAKAAMRALKGTVFGVEGDPHGRATAAKLVTAIGGIVLELDSTQMAAYHTAAALASNYVVATIDAAAQVLASAGVAPDAAARALVPLAEGALRNVAQRGT